MMRFASGLALGVILGVAVPAIGQWSYVGVYKGKELAAAPSYVGVYGAGVYDALMVSQYHRIGGGAGQAHVDRAFGCLRSRIYAKNFSKWAAGIFASDPNHYAAFTLVDHACDGVTP